MKTYLSIQTSVSEEIVGLSTAGGRVDHCLPVGDGDGLCCLLLGEEARESGGREVARFVRGASNVACHDKRREMNGKRGFTRT